jgi:carboxyl-terminal processing protease
MPPTAPPPPKEPKKGIPTSSAVFITILVAVVAFTAGTRIDEYSALQGLLDGGSNQSEGLPDDLDYSSVEKVYDRLRAKFDGNLTEEDLLNGIKSGLAKASGDDYTVYLDAEQAAQFTDDLNGTFSGIGAEIGLEKELLIVVSPLDGFPADKAGLKPKDTIIKIDDEDAVGFTVEEAVLKIRGPEGTDVKLTVLRDGQQLEFTITRASIVIPSVNSEVKDGIGYLRISRFSEDTVALARQAADDFINQNVKGVILDLRNNSGGFLSAAVDVTSLWSENQPVVQQRENGGQKVTETLSSGSKAQLKGIPTVVLINEGSASASEIVAGALQDYGAAKLVGQTSFGKGSVQSLEKFSDGSVLKVTIARWYTPNGRNIDHEGIKPDIEVEITDEDIDLQRDSQRLRAESELNL